MNIDGRLQQHRGRSAILRSVRALPICLVAAVLVGLGCASKDSQLEGAYRALKMIEGATSVGVAYLRYAELVQIASGELLIAKQRASSQRERECVVRYERALGTYKDASDLWPEKIGGAKYSSLVPEGKIYVAGKVAEIVGRYDLPTEHGTGYAASLTFVSEDAIQLLWVKAKNQVASGDSLLLESAK